jgi:hypothetical protein
MANQVMRMPDPAPPVQPEALSKDDEAVQRKAIAISSVNDGFLQQKCSESEQAAQSTDEQSLLSPAIQQPSFGHDLSRIAVRPPQAKLTVGEPGDKYEQEADWMANQVMRMVVPDQLNAQSVQFVQNSLQRKCAACEEEEDKVQTKPSIQTATDGGLQAGNNIESRLNSSKGGGSPLAPDVRSFMEPRFGADFSGVQVHTGSDAVQMNRELNAQAFTHGSDVYFGAGKSAGNNELTAHELTHVVQQNSGIQAKSNIQAEILQRDCDPTLASCPPDQTTTPTTPGQTQTPAPGPTSDDYKQGYQDGLKGGESQAVPRDGDALTDYNEGYAKGHYEFTQGSASPAPATPETDQQPAAPAQGQRGLDTDPNAGQPNQSVDPTVQPPANGVSTVTNPYAGTSLENAWKEGFDDGFAQPDEDHLAPSPLSPDAQTVYSEGVLAGKDAVRQQPNSSQSAQIPSSSDTTHETSADAQGGLTTGEIVAIGVVVVGVIAVGAVIAFSGGSLAAPILATVLSITPAAEAGLESAAAVGALGTGAEVALVIDAAAVAAPAVTSAAATGTAGAAATVAIQSTVAGTAAASSSTLAAVVTVAAATTAATTLSGDSPTSNNEPEDGEDCPPIILFLPSAKAQDFDAYVNLIGQLEHIPNRPRETGQRSRWKALMPGRIPPPVWDRAQQLGLSKDDVIFPFWSRTTIYDTSMQVDHLIEMQVTPIGREKQFDVMAYYRLMDASSNGGAGSELMNNIRKMRETLVTCHNGDPEWMNKKITFESVAPSSSNNPGIWTKEDLIAGEHLEAYRKLKGLPN